MKFIDFVENRRVCSLQIEKNKTDASKLFVSTITHLQEQKENVSIAYDYVFSHLNLNDSGLLNLNERIIPNIISNTFCPEILESHINNTGRAIERLSVILKNFNSVKILVFDPLLSFNMSLALDLKIPPSKDGGVDFFD